MVNIVNGLVDKKVGKIRFFLNYPKIEVEGESEEVEKLNKTIKNDIEIFEEVVMSTFDYKRTIGNINVISEFQTAFNKNNIISTRYI